MDDYKPKLSCRTCFREHSYRYDSFDPKYETLKYTRRKACKDCPLANEGICQKIYKVKITTNLRKYTAPARGSKAWKTIFKRRTAVERVNAYLARRALINEIDSNICQISQVFKSRFVT